MKKSVRNGVVLLLAVLTVLVLAGCSMEPSGSLSSDASVSVVSVSGVQALTLGTPSTDWEEAVRNAGHVYLDNSKLERAEVAVKASAGSTVFLAQSKADVQPFFVSDTSFDFDPEDFLFVEVFSENLDAFTIYAISIHNRNPGITDFTLGGRSVVGGQSAAGQTIPKYGKLGTPGSSWNDPQMVAGEAWFGTSQVNTSLAVTAAPEVNSVKARVTVTDDDTSPPNFSGPYYNADAGLIRGINGSAKADGYLYLEIKGDTFSSSVYYKFKLLSKSDNRTITNPRFILWDGTTKIGEYPVSIGTMGTSSWSGSEAYGDYSNGAEISGGAGTVQTVNVNSTSILSAYMDTGTTLPGVTGSDNSLPDYQGVRPPTDFKVEFKADYDGDIKFSVDKNQRASPAFENTTGNFGKLLGFWWWAVEATNELGEKGWYKFATRIGSEKTELGDVTVGGETVVWGTVTGNLTAAQLLSSNNYATVTLPASADLSNLKVVAKAPGDYQPLIGMAMAPTATTNVPQVTFNLNQDENYKPTTGTNESTIFLETGNFIYIRVLAEISWLYGGSGFTGATWNPARTAAGGNPAYTAWKFYKIQVLKEQASDDAELAGLKYKGGDVTVPVANAKVTETVDASGQTFGTDNKSNVTVSTTVTRNWSDQASNDISIGGDTIPSFEAVLDTNSSGASVDYALAVNTDAVSAEDFYSKDRFEQIVTLSTNTWLVIRVTAESGKVVNYYRYHLINGEGADYTLSDITINTTSIGTLAAPDKDYITTTAISVNLAKDTFKKVTLAVTKPNSSEVAFGLYSVTSSVDWKGNVTIVDNTEFTIADDGSIVYENFPVAQIVVIRVISADRTQTRYYKLRLVLSTPSTNTAISKITIAGVDIPTLPGANNVVTGTTSVNYSVPGADNTVLNNLQVSVEGATGTTIRYAAAAANNTETAAAAFTNEDGKFEAWTNAQYLVIRVFAEDNITVRYYKVRIVWGDNNTTLTDIKINRASITTETGVSIPPVNDEATGINAAVYHTATLTNLSASVDAPVTSSVSFGTAASGNVAPTTWTSATANLGTTIASFTANQWLVIRVTAQDTITIGYYKVRIVNGSAATAITGITINGTSIGTLPAANTAVTGTTAGAYTSTAALNPVTVAVEGTSGGATVTYASAEADDTSTLPANFTNTASFPNFTSGQYVVIRVTSQDAVNAAYYKVRVIHGNADADLESIRINNGYVVPVPSANSAVDGTTAGTQTGVTLTGGLTVKVGASSGASVAYGVASDDSTAPADFNNTTGVFSTFTSDDYVVIRVISQDLQTTQYYKVQVSN